MDCHYWCACDDDRSTNPTKNKNLKMKKLDETRYVYNPINFTYLPNHYVVFSTVFNRCKTQKCLLLCLWSWLYDVPSTCCRLVDEGSCSSWALGEAHALLLLLFLISWSLSSLACSICAWQEGSVWTNTLGSNYFPNFCFTFPCNLVISAFL